MNAQKLISSLTNFFVLQTNSASLAKYHQKSGYHQNVELYSTDLF
jgi:hypothetical protein